MLSTFVAVDLFLDSLAHRFRSVGRNERGQTAAEYLGIVVAVAALVGILATTDIGTAIKDAIMSQISKIGGD
jgi:pilus assembly protein Flp/PilA